MLSNKHLVTVCATAFACNMTLLVIIALYNAQDKCFITIDQQNVAVNIPDTYLSVGIDVSEIQDYHTVDFSNKQFKNLASALSPARIRLGGTMSDRLIFSPDDIPSVSCNHCPYNTVKAFCSSLKKVCRHKFLPFFVMTGPKWIEINNFCKDTGLQLMFPLNVLLRDDHEWNLQNAMELIKFSKSNKFDIDWQLGNEPNSFRHVFNRSVNPHDLAQDFKKLRKLLNQSGYEDSLLIGPDTTRPQERQPYCLKYMVEFLGNASQYVNVRSWHQYYLNSRTAKLEDFWDPDTFDLLDTQIQTMKRHTQEYEYIPMWLTETSSSYGGGAPGLSNSYAGTPLWLDKLGLAARNNITTVVRQSFYGGNYSLIDKNLQPLPDWWVSVLYKKLVGNKVLRINCHCSRYQRVYAHCANRKYTNDTTAITIYAVNLEMKKMKFLLNGTALSGNHLNIDEYVISAPHNDRFTKVILLNGQPLYYESSTPDFDPHQRVNDNHIRMPPYSVGFWVVKNTSLTICD
ncbi:unnamed protein product [Leptosia nina]|uniref:Heparanase n=1 Tax=Leptosia nina TaxID=320188 RepID=A0AAV1K1P7_9NEOP